jgi:hypothetical protein
MVSGSDIRFGRFVQLALHQVEVGALPLYFWKNLYLPQLVLPNELFQVLGLVAGYMEVSSTEEI